MGHNKLRNLLSNSMCPFVRKYTAWLDFSIDYMYYIYIIFTLSAAFFLLKYM